MSNKESIIHSYIKSYYQNRFNCTNCWDNNDYSSRISDQTFSYLFSPKFKQIKIRTFKNAWIVPRQAFSSYTKLFNYLSRLRSIPAHIYATVLRFLNASRLTTKNHSSICLGGPFVIDFDINGHLLYAREELDQLKRKVSDAADLLHDWYGFSNFEYLFSGHRGFHLYALDFSELYFKRLKYNGKMGYKREQYESQQRHRIAWQLQQAGLNFDYPISTDTRRVIRVPETLHGSTGLRCMRLESEKALIEFELEDACAFKNGGYDNVPFNNLALNNIQVKVIRCLPPFFWSGEEYQGNRGAYLQVPLSLAVLLTLQQDVIPYPRSPFVELFEQN